MTTNAIAISRELEGAGFDKKQADAIAELVVTRLEAHINEHINDRVDDRIADRIDSRDKNLATKGDVSTAVARVEGKVNTTQANLATKDAVNAVKDDVNAVKDDVNAVKDDVARLESKIDTNHSEFREFRAETKTKMNLILWGIGIGGSMLGGAILLLLRLLAAT